MLIGGFSFNASFVVFSCVVVDGVAVKEVRPNVVKHGLVRFGESLCPELIGHFFDLSSGNKDRRFPLPHTSSVVLFHDGLCVFFNRPLFFFSDLCQQTSEFFRLCGVIAKTINLTLAVITKEGIIVIELIFPERSTEIIKARISD
jgi:hypothetical protein